jgi:hypothetical protein
MDDDGNSYPASPRWQALEHLLQTKRKAEALRAESKPQIAAATYKKLTAKRTQKPKGDQDGKSPE